MKLGKLKDRLEEWFNTEEGCDLVMDEIIGDVELLEQQKDSAYAERNNLVLLLAGIYDSWMEKHPESDESWDDDWRNIVFIQLPTGQASWHIHDSEYNRFKLVIKKFKTGNSWDGHTTEQKYERVEQAAKTAWDEGCPVCGDAR